MRPIGILGLYEEWKKRKQQIQKNWAKSLEAIKRK